VPGDSNYSNVSLLLHCDGTNGSTTFTDNGPDARTVSRTGTPTITTAQSKWGGASADMPGSGSYLTSAAGSQWDFGTGDFCVEMWVRSSSTSAFQTVASTNTWTTATAGDWALYTRHNSVQRVVFTYVNASATFVDINSSIINVHDGSWHHVAVTRSGTTIRLFVDGAQLGSATYAGQIGRSDKTLTLGAHVGDSRSFTGNLDDIRITKGVARYTAAFTAPTEAFPDGPPPNEAYVLADGPLSSPALLGAQSRAWVAADGPLVSPAILGTLRNAFILADGPLGAPAALGSQAVARVAADGPLGAAAVLGAQRFAFARTESPLGAPAIRGTMPTVAFVAAPGPLGSPAALAWHDFTGQVSERAVLYYVADLITPGGTVRVPISSWQATLDTDGAGYVQCVIPACAPWVDTIVAATEFVIYRRATLTNGEAIEYEMARSPVGFRDYAQGPSNYTVTISGYPDALTPNASPPTTFDRTLTGVRQVSQGDGGIRVRADIDWLLRPGMRAYYGSTPVLVDYINFYVPGNDQYMDLGERA
jgi:hypothetical protein